MSDPFRRHGVMSLSPSALGLFRDSPALWCLRYLHGFRSEESMPRAWLGKAVEAGVDWALYEGPDGALAAAQRQFENDAQGEASDECEQARSDIAPFLEQALALMLPLGRPIARQLRIETWLDGIEVPVTGYLDYLYPEVIVDLKTGKNLPGAAKPEHKAQVAIYWKARDVVPSLAYVTGKKGAVYPVTPEECEDALRSLRQSAQALRRQLTLARSKEDFAAMHWPNTDHFRWSDEARKVAATIWR